MREHKPLIQKCRDMIFGCRTAEQLETALNYCLLAKKQLAEEDHIKIYNDGFWKLLELRKVI